MEEEVSGLGRGRRGQMNVIVDKGVACNREHQLTTQYPLSLSFLIRLLTQSRTAMWLLHFPGFQLLLL